MKFKGTLIVVKDCNKALKYYHDMFGFELIRDNDGNMELSGNLYLQEEKYWEGISANDIEDEDENELVMTINRQTDRMIENMITWAMEKQGSTEYAGWCLSFIEDALEISNGIEIFGGDSAKESFELYKDALRNGIPERGAFVFYDCLCPCEGGSVNWGHCGISLGDGRLIHAWDKVRTDDYRKIEQMTALTGDHPKYLGWVPITRVLAQKPQKTEQ